MIFTMGDSALLICRKRRQADGYLAYLFHISSYTRWIGNNEAELKAGYYYNDKNELHAVFRVKKIRDKWAVEGARQYDE